MESICCERGDIWDGISCAWRIHYFSEDAYFIHMRCFLDMINTPFSLIVIALQIIGFSWESMSKSSSLCCWTMQSEWSLRLFFHTYWLQNGCAWELVITWYVHPVRTEQAVIMSCQCMNMCPATYFRNPTNISRYTTSKLCLVGLTTKL